MQHWWACFLCLMFLNIKKIVLTPNVWTLVQMWHSSVKEWTREMFQTWCKHERVNSAVIPSEALREFVMARCHDGHEQRQFSVFRPHFPLWQLLSYSRSKSLAVALTLKSVLRQPMWIYRILTALSEQTDLISSLVTWQTGKVIKIRFEKKKSDLCAMWTKPVLCSLVYSLTLILLHWTNFFGCFQNVIIDRYSNSECFS